MSKTEKHSTKGLQQPEALATFAAAAREDGKKPDALGLKATPATAPLPEKLAKQHDAATKVLREGTLHKREGAMAAVKALKDRTRSS